MKDVATGDGVTDKGLLAAAIAAGGGDGNEDGDQGAADGATVELTGRDLIIAQVEARRRDELREEGVVLPVDEGGPSERTADALGDGAGDELPQLFEIKTEGVTSQVFADEINQRLETDGPVTPERVKEFQKHVVADRRLEEAAAQRKQNEARAADLAQQEAALAVMRATPAGAVPVEISPELVANLTDSILTEDHEATAQALREIVSSARGPASASSPAITEDQLNQAARNALAAQEYERDLSKGREEVQKKFGHLLGDSTLAAAVDRKAAEIFGADRSKGPREILLEAAQAVNNSILRAAGKPERTEADIRLENKRNAAGHVVIPLTTGRAPGPRGPEPAKTTQQTVAEMVAERNRNLSGR